MTIKNMTVAYIYIYQMDYSLNTVTRCTKLNLYLLSGRLYTLYNICIKITSSKPILMNIKHLLMITSKQNLWNT